MIRLAIVLMLLLTSSAAAQSDGLRLRDSAIVAAVRFARGLQTMYWDSLYLPHKQTPPGTAILAHYRRGYGDSLAKVYTAYSLSHAPEPVMAVPNDAHVDRASDTDAVVTYETPEVLREIWDAPAFTTDYVRREADRWVVVRSKQTNDKAR